MKYGVLTATALYADMPYLNLGDQMQSEAIWYIYQKMGIPKHDIVTVDWRSCSVSRRTGVCDSPAQC